MKIIVTAQAGAHQGYDLDCATAYLDAMDQLRADPTTKMDKIEAALRLLGKPMPTGGTTVIALFPEARKVSTLDRMNELTARVYQAGPWARRRS